MFKFLRQRILSFKWAIKGIFNLFSTHPNAQIHLLAAIIVIPLSFFLQISITEGCIVALCIALVLSMEALNSAIEYLADKVSAEEDELIGKAKDISAAAVLISALAAAIVGGLIFIPKICLIFS
jgi:diacylglycerol kinase